MKKTFTLLTSCLLSFLFASCGSSPESIAEDMIGEIKAMTEILEEVESKEDLESAKDDLEECGERIGELKKEMESVKKELSKEEMKELEDKYRKEIAAASLELFGAAMKAAAYGFEMPEIQ